MGVTVREKPKGSGVWWVFMRHNNKRGSKRVGSEEAAREVAQIIEAKLVLGDFKIGQPRPIVPLFKDLSKKWLDSVALTRKKGTHERYHQLARDRILPNFGKKPVDEIKKKDVREFFLAQAKKGVPKKTLQVIRAVLNGPLEMAFQDETIPANPVTGVLRSLNLEGTPDEIRVLDAKEQILLLETAKNTAPATYPLLLLLLRAGPRLGEALALQWEDLDLEKGLAWIRKTYRRGSFGVPKNGRPRPVRLSHETIGILKGLKVLNGADPQTFVFSADKEGKIPLHQNTVRNRFKKILGEAKINSGVRIHSLRHTYVTNRLSLGHPLEQVSKEAGHSSVEITSTVYSHWIPDKTADMINELDLIGLPAARHPATPLQHPATNEEPVTN